MPKIIEATNRKATCYAPTKEGIRGPIWGQVDDCTWRFDIEGMSANELSGYALYGLCVKNADVYRAAVRATKKEGYVGKTIGQINTQYKVMTIVVKEAFKRRAAADPVGNIEKRINALNAEELERTIKLMQAKLKSKKA